MRFCSNDHANKARRNRNASGLTPCAVCPSCGGRRSDSRKDSLCRSCKKGIESARIAALTLAELRSSLSISQYHAKIRGWARAAYTGPMQCLSCGYSLHVDVCHVRDVSDFPKASTIGEVNAPENLVALCKNHHWEFDNGHLAVSGLLKPVRGRVA